MEFGMKYVTLLDEISTGLDSAAAFDIVAAQRKLAKQMNRTVVISLLQPSPELLLILLVFLSLVFFLAAASANLSIAEPVVMVCVLFYVLFAGFIVSKNQIPDWLVWLYWLDPVAWTVCSVAVSQYRNPELDVCVYGAFDYCAMYNQTMGEFSLGLFDVPSAKSWIGYGIFHINHTGVWGNVVHVPYS